MAWINRKIRLWVLPLLTILSATHGYGQDTLPAFSAVLRAGNKVQISWVNFYGDKIRQLSIQRSRDSQRLFKTIVSIPDPKVLRNGFIDSKLVDSNNYYRLYILLDSGRYVFSTPKRPEKYVPPSPPPKIVQASPVTVGVAKKYPAAGIKPPRPVISEGEKIPPAIPEKEKAIVKEAIPVPVPIPEKIYTIKRGDTLVGVLNENLLRRFRDSISLKTKDTIAVITRDTIFIKPYVAKDTYRLSKYIFLDRSGVVHVELPDAAKKKYRVRFFEEDKSLLFEIKDIRDPILLLDKANFQHAGWFLFEIYDDGNLIEKNRFYISKDF